MSDIMMISQAVSTVRAPLFRRVEQTDELGVFDVELEVPGQEWWIEPVAEQDGRRMYTVRVYIGEELVLEQDYPEESIQHIRVAYASSHRVTLLGSVVDGAGVESDIQDCRYVLVLVTTGYALDFEGCGNALVSDCVIEGESGLLARKAAVQVLDCEIIADNEFITKDDDSAVFEQNVKKVQR